uniref:ATP-dependent RNA helicase n=1 Tax=Globodera rostochiensis TaxID=31243 RepID=A0A914HD68_GLORO
MNSSVNSCEAGDVCSSSTSSGDEFVDLDLEFSSAGEMLFSLPKKDKSFVEQSLKEIEAGCQKEGGGVVELSYPRVGLPHVGPTAQTKIVLPAWVVESKRFSAQIDTSDDHMHNGLQLDNLRPEFLHILQKSISFWFPVQRSVLPTLLQSANSVLPPRDLVICSPTGSGKTLCYVLPMLNALRICAFSPSSVFALVIAPVMNLEFEKLNFFGANIVLLGKNDYRSERSALFPNGTRKCKAHVIVATPGRFVEHLLDENGDLDLSMLRYLVVDEADRMQDMARMEWLELVEKYANVPSVGTLSVSSLTDRSHNNWLQRILVSATLSLDVHSLHNWNLRCPILFQAEKQMDEGSTKPSVILPSSLTHKLIVCKQNTKPLFLYRQIVDNSDKWNRVIVFVNTKQTSKRLSTLMFTLSKKRIKVAEFSANLFKNRRQKLLREFQKGEIQVLIACDVLSRGIDVLDVDCVINYDLPINERIFIHRAGRTARAMKEGVLVSLTTKEEKMKLKKLLSENNLWDGIQKTKANDLDFDDEILHAYEKALIKLKKRFEK